MTSSRVAQVPDKKKRPRAAGIREGSWDCTKSAEVKDFGALNSAARTQRLKELSWKTASIPDTRGRDISLLHASGTNAERLNSRDHLFKAEG